MFLILLSLGLFNFYLVINYDLFITTLAPFTHKTLTPLTLLKYIHLNPVEARICNHPEDYELSSYTTYVDNNKFSWLTTHFAHDYFNDTAAFKAFHEIGNSKTISKLFSKKQLPSSL